MDGPIRVLCVFGALDRGGAETMCMNLYRHINRSKIQFDFVKHTDSIGDYEDEIQSLGGKVFTAPTLTIQSYLKYKKWWKQHLEEHPEHKIVHGHMFTIAYVYFKIAHQMERITICHSHSSKPLVHLGIKDLLKAFLRRKTERESDYCLACSNEAGNFLFPHREYIVIKNAIDVRSYGFNAKIRDQIRKEFAISGNEKVVGVIGSLISVKNPYGTLDIFQRLYRKDEKTKLLWCGAGEMRPLIEEEIEKRGFQDAIILAGVRNDINNVLQAIDVYIMPSFYEGLPVAAIEAQAAGIPCILSNNISREVAITKCCSFIDLNTPDLWVNEILEAFKKGRTDTTAQIIANGYDVKTTSSWLEKFYLSLNEN